MTYQGIVSRSLVPVVAGLALAASAPLSAENHDEDEDELELDDAFIFLELNAKDQDLGIHFDLDGVAWRRMTVEAPNGRRIARFRVSGGLGQQGMTQLEGESDEPEIPDEIDVATVLGRAPEGEYEFEGRTVDGQDIEGAWELSHVMAAAAEAVITVDGEAWECDGTNPTSDVTFSWSEVTTAYDDDEVDPEGLLGDGAPLVDDNEPVLYTLVVEREEDDEAGLPLLVSSVDLPPEAADGLGSFAVTIPGSFFSLGGIYKWEIIVRTGTHNQTSYEGCITEAEE